MRRKKVMKRKKINLTQIYQNSRDHIEKMILSEVPGEDTEIDIEKAFLRSTRTLTNYSTLDWDHRREIITLIAAINNYLNDYSKTRPLNFIMIAQPGSGKSHFIKCVAKKMSLSNISAVTYNMATMQSLEDIVQPLESVRNLKVQDQLPILFLDEFDSNPANYAFLLPLLWDGELHVGNRNLKLGKVIIILAGSDLGIKKVMQSARNMNVNDDNMNVDKDNKKIIDLLSRINGGVFEIPDLDIKTKSRDRRTDKICIALSLLKSRFGDELQSVPWCFLNFIGNTKFRYGVRSIFHLIDLIPLKKTSILDVNDLSLPLNNVTELKKSSLAYHLISDSEPEAIIDKWKVNSACKTLVHFQTIDENGDY